MAANLAAGVNGEDYATPQLIVYMPLSFNANSIIIIKIKPKGRPSAKLTNI